MNTKELKEKIKHLPVPTRTHNNEVFKDITKSFTMNRNSKHLMTTTEWDEFLERAFDS